MNGAVGGGRRIVAPRMEIVNGTTCYVFPVTGLKVEGAWNVGPVTISSGSAADEAVVDGVPSLCRPGEPLDDVRRAVLDADTTADVVAASVAHALSLVREALDVLRVFYRVETSAVRTIGEFGLPGEVNSGYVPYLARPSHEGGFVHVGHFIGAELTDLLRDRWEFSKAFRFVASTIGGECRNDGEGRAARAVALLGQSLRSERDTSLQYALTIFALDALLKGPGAGAQTYAVARRAIYFGCGRASGGLCGRDRDTCSYLALNPHFPRDRKKLDKLKSCDDVWWRCTEWLQVVSWFDQRAGFVHHGEATKSVGGTFAPDYWIYASLLTPILEWLKDHSDNPISDLDSVLAALPDPPDWSARAVESGHGER